MNPRALQFSKRSIAEVLYPKDAIVVCRNPECGKPLYRLSASIFAGENVEKSTAKYVPVTIADLRALAHRTDLEPGQRALFKTLSVAEWHQHCERIHELKPDSFADCPACKESFVFGSVPDDHDGTSRFVGGARGYVITLAFIPPAGQSRRTA